MIVNEMIVNEMIANEIIVDELIVDKLTRHRRWADIVGGLRRSARKKT
jgi:hypothetical protein